MPFYRYTKRPYRTLYLNLFGFELGIQGQGEPTWGVWTKVYSGNLIVIHVPLLTVSISRRS